MASRCPRETPALHIVDCKRYGRNAMINRNRALPIPAMTQAAPSKLTSLAELVARVPDGCALGLGGVFLHRGPFALVRELARQKRRELEIIKPSPGYDLDLLCRSKTVARVRAGIVAMEGNFGLAPWYRRAIERKEAELEEHA